MFTIKLALSISEWLINCHLLTTSSEDVQMYHIHEWHYVPLQMIIVIINFKGHEGLINYSHESYKVLYKLKLVWVIELLLAVYNECVSW